MNESGPLHDLDPARESGRAAAAPGPSPQAGDILAPLLAQRRLLICVGSGGVGKTTAAAALGLSAALRGRRTAVLTIDPAQRLRDALGIETLAGEPHRVPLDRVRRAVRRHAQAHSAESSRGAGSLDAMLLDAKRTFDDLIRGYAPSEAAAERVLQNRIYQSVSSALAGSQDYMAMERLHTLAMSDRYDLLVVDTPPTHHALDFLEAPERLTALLSSRAATILQNPASILAGGSRLAQAALSAVLRGLERFTGLELLRDIAEFVGGLETFSEGFQERARTMACFLRRRETAFLIVTTAEPARIAESLAFHRELVRAGLPFAGFVVNRVLPRDLLPERPPAIEGEHDSALARKLVALERQLASLVASERAQIVRLAAAAPAALLVLVPLQTQEPTSLSRLARILG